MRGQKVLQSGAVSAKARRRTTLVVVLIAWLARVWTHVNSGMRAPEATASLRDYFTSPSWPWVDAPLPDLIVVLAHTFGSAGWTLFAVELVAATITVVMILRLGERWLGFEAGVIGSLLWALAAPMLTVFTLPASAGWHAALALLTAGAMLRVAHRRRPETAWKIGVCAGLYSLFGGGGLWWVLGAWLWLPFASAKFRGWGFARSAALVLAGWLVVVMPLAVRNAAVSGGDPKIPGAGDLARLHAAVHTERLEQLPLTASALAGPVSVAYTDSVLHAHDLPARLPEWSRATNLLSLTLQRASQDGGAGWSRALHRAVATLGGWSPADATSAPGLPWVAIVLLAWAGVTAVLPGVRQLFPLVLGGAVPVLQASLLGIGSGALLAASPFVCLYAGYGAWRIWDGRRSALTWAIAPLVLLLAAMLHLWVRSWR